MANSKLQHKRYKIPDKLLEYLGNTLQTNSQMVNTRGFKRLKNILDKKVCTYEQLKRIKNYFDTVDPENFNESEYNLNGGDRMKKWVNKALEVSRAQVKDTKTARHNAGIDNSFRQPGEDDPVSDAMPTNIRTRPALMSNNALVEQVDRIKVLINKEF